MKFTFNKKTYLLSDWKMVSSHFYEDYCRDYIPSSIMKPVLLLSDSDDDNPNYWTFDSDIPNLIHLYYSAFPDISFSKKENKQAMKHVDNFLLNIDLYAIFN